MYTTPPKKKTLMLNILDILKKYSDVNHRLSAKISLSCVLPSAIA